VDVAFYVLEARGEVEIGKERATAEKGNMVESQAGIPHLEWNVGDVRLRIVVIKLPRPTKRSALANPLGERNPLVGSVIG
jgi:mannose-6-phosphate isomerase-like protein (cupin superfamily)